MVPEDVPPDGKLTAGRHEVTVVLDVIGAPGRPRFPETGGNLRAGHQPVVAITAQAPATASLPGWRVHPGGSLDGVYAGNSACRIRRRGIAERAVPTAHAYGVGD